MASPNYDDSLRDIVEPLTYKKVMSVVTCPGWS